MTAPAALLAAYEVRFLRQQLSSQQLRIAGLAGDPSGGLLHGSSASLDEEGRIDAITAATWQPVGDVPAREPGRAEPVRAYSPLKASRPEARTSEDWGRSTADAAPYRHLGHHL